MKQAEEWRLIDSGASSAQHNMALDEAIAYHVRKGISPPTLRLYGWKKPSLSLGCFQKVAGINTEYCDKNSIPIVRRPTGGRAILHDNELTYSFSVRTDSGNFSRGLLDSYQKISGALRLAFKRSNIKADSQRVREKGYVLTRSPLCFKSSSFGEILIDNRKVVGSAQKRWRDGMLQQGTIPFLYNEEVLRHIFGADKTAEMREFSVGLKEVKPELKHEEFKAIIAKAFEETFGIRFVPDRPLEKEHLLAGRLAVQKYVQRSWNFRS
jgi:lipoate-protein ligase A